MLFVRKQSDKILRSALTAAYKEGNIIAMVSKFRKALKTFFYPDYASPPEERSSRLLFVLIRGLLITDIITWALVSVLLLIEKTGDSALRPTWWAMVIFALLMLVALFLEARGYTRIATWTVIVALILGIFGANLEAAGGGKTLIYFVIPIMIAATLLRPSSAYGAAGIVSAIMVILFFVYSPPPMILITPAAFFVTAMIAWLFARSQEQAFQHMSRLDELKSKFISDVSHELRTPINNLLNYSELLVEDTGLIEVEKIHEVLLQEANRAAELADSILDASKMGMSFDDSKIEPVEIVAMLKKIKDSLMSAAHGKQLFIEFEDGDRPLFVEGYPERLETICRNLLVNAVNYTERGGVTITCDARDEDVVITISDTGIGIPEADLDFIFERFYRGEGVRQSTIPGTGLGLSIVKENMVAHNGTITVESEEDKGTKFTVTLPQR